jgi:hypothetical protein
MTESLAHCFFQIYEQVKKTFVPIMGGSCYSGRRWNLVRSEFGARHERHRCGNYSPEKYVVGRFSDSGRMVADSETIPGKGAGPSGTLSLLTLGATPRGQSTANHIADSRDSRIFPARRRDSS